MPEPHWIIGRDSRFEAELTALGIQYPKVELVWTAVKWAIAHDPIRTTIEAGSGIRARTTLGRWGVPPLVWFLIVSSELHEVEFVGVSVAASGDEDR